MYQLAMVGVAFVCLFIMLKKKVNFGAAMAITAVILTLLAGLGLKGLMEVIYQTLTSPKSFDTCAAVFTIGILGGLCGRYGLLDRIVDGLGDLISSKKVIAMIIPALMGMMPVPGGAVMSVPFIDKLGEDIELSQPRKSAINLVFRHVSMLVLPYSTSLLMISSILPQVGLYDIIPLNAAFIVVLLLAGYYCFIKDVKILQPNQASFSFKKLARFLIDMSPIYVCIILNFSFGIPIYLGAIVSFLIVYLLSDKVDFWGKFKASVNFNVVGTILGVLLLQNVIGRLDGLLGLLTGSIGTGLWAMGLLAVAAWFFGTITGLSLASLGIILPILGAMGLSGNALLVYTYAVFVSSYIGYFFSPLHLCQVFTNEFLCVSTGEIYTEYRRYFVITILTAVVTSLGFYFLLI